MKIGRILVVLGAIATIMGGALHSIGGHFFIPKVAATGMSESLFNVFRALWWGFAVELFILGPAVIWMSRLPRSRGLIILTSLIPGLTACVMLHYVGGFVGSYSMVLAFVLLFAGGLLLPSDSPS